MASLKHAGSTVLLGLCLMGCGDAGYQGHAAGDGYIDTWSEASTRVCGANEYSGPQGADVSYFQPNFVWTGKGLVFGYARISDGLNTIDTEFTTNWQAMKDAGIQRGAYQYFEPTQDAAAEANMMVTDVGQLGPGDMPCMIDVETTGGLPPSTLASKIQTWLNVVEQGTGKKPTIYVTASFWETNVQSTNFGGYPLWVANWGTSCPKIPNGWSNWTIWQYCNGDPQYCTNGQNFDRDVFNGTEAQLKSFAGGGGGGGGGPEYGAQYVNQSFPPASQALTMTEGQTLPAYITLKNIGAKAWDAQTELATTQPRDRQSEFADSSWLSPNRPAQVSGTVPPGGNYKFSFDLHAPSKAGTYVEHFGVVEQGVTWFSDPGQGGPPDDQLAVQIQVRASTGSGGSGSGGLPPEVPANSGGCGCRLEGSPRDDSGPCLALLLVCGWVVRRRRRQAARHR